MTLIELTIAMTILAIMVGIAVPTFRNFAADSRTASASSDLSSALAIARNEAIRRSSRAIACASTTGATCSGSTNWANGWLVFADLDNDGAVGADELVQVWPALGTQLTATGSASSVVYTGLGMVTNGVTLTLTPVSCVGDRIRRSTVTMSGSTQNSRLTCP